MPLPFTKRLVDADAYYRNRFTKARIIETVCPPIEHIPQIDLFMKEMFRVQDAHVLFDHVLPKLEHENDGLIFTVDGAPYYPGTCPQIWKWKPMELNTIDYDARPIENPNLPHIWSLHCSDGGIFDLIVLTESQLVEYKQWRETKAIDPVLECNFDHELAKEAESKVQKMHALVNSLKLKHQVDECQYFSEEDGDDDYGGNRHESYQNKEQLKE